MAVHEKSKLIKSMRRFDMLFFTICALVGVDTLGQVSSWGAATFTWVAILAVAFLLPYALIMSEVGSAFTQEGGPYEWMKLSWGRLPAGLGSILYWVTNPLWWVASASPPPPPAGISRRIWGAVGRLET
jgi:amino acid transporter